MMAASSSRSIRFESTMRNTGPPLHPPRFGWDGIRSGVVAMESSRFRTIPTVASPSTLAFPANQVKPNFTLPAFASRYIVAYPPKVIGSLIDGGFGGQEETVAATLPAVERKTSDNS